MNKEPSTGEMLIMFGWLSGIFPTVLSAVLLKIVCVIFGW